MALKLLDFETGPEGAALTGNAQGGNSGATQIAAASGGSAIFAKDVVRSGILGARFTSGTSALAIGRFATAATNNVVSIGLVFLHKQTPTLLTGVLSLRHSGGVAGRINWNPDNSVSLVDAALGNTLTIATGLTPGAIYELTIRAKSATATTGTVTAVLYSAAGVELGRATSSTYNLGTNPFAAVDVGVINTNSATGTIVALDYLQLDDGQTNELRAPGNAPAYSGAATTTSGTAAAGVGQPTTSGTGATSALTTATGAGTPATSGSAATTTATASTAASAFSVTGQGATTSGTAAAGVGQPTTSGAGAAAVSTSASGTGRPSTAGSGATPAGATTVGAGASSEDAGGNASTIAGATAAASGLPRVRAAATTTASTSAAASGLVGLRGSATTPVAASAAASGRVAFVGDAVTVVEVVTVGSRVEEAHDVEVEAWVGRKRFAAALGATRYDAVIKRNRWKARL